MRCTLQWSLSGHQHVCISNSQEAITQATKGYLRWIFMCPWNDTFNKNKKISMSELGLNSKDRKSTRDKANISNPKVNRGCAPFTTNCPHLSRLCAHFTWTLNTTYFTGGLPYWGIQRYAWNSRCRTPCSAVSYCTIIQGLTVLWRNTSFQHMTLFYDLILNNGRWIIYLIKWW